MNKLYGLIGFIVGLPFLVFYLIAGEAPNEEYATNQHDDIQEDQTNEM